MKLTFGFLALALMASMRSIEGAPFINLDFESATTNKITSIPQTPAPSYPFGLGTVEDLLPGWSVRFGDRVQSSVLLNARPAGANFVGVVSPEAVKEIDFRRFFSAATFPDGLAGKYGLYVNALETPYVLTQRGDVPSDAQLLSTDTFVAQGMRLEIRMDGVLIQEIHYELGPDLVPIRFREIDISPFAGRSVELELRFFLAGSFSDFPGPSVGVDGMSFRGDMDLTVTRASRENANEVILQFAALPGRDYLVEFREGLDPDSPWQPLAGAPHNSGSVVDTAASNQRFYRVRSVPAG